MNNIHLNRIIIFGCHLLSSNIHFTFIFSLATPLHRLHLRRHRLHQDHQVNHQYHHQFPHQLNPRLHLNHPNRNV
jgi:hypothetical protein